MDSSQNNVPFSDVIFINDSKEEWLNKLKNCVSVSSNIKLKINLVGIGKGIFFYSRGILRAGGPDNRLFCFSEGEESPGSKGQDAS
jgi:hypothetical protein